MSTLNLQSRRKTMKAILAMLLPTAACSEQKGKGKPSDEDAALQRKFREINGGELIIDALVPLCNTVIYRANGDIFPGGGRSCHGPKGASGMSYFGDERSGENYSMPKLIRMLRYPAEADYSPNWDYNNFNVLPRWKGAAVVDITVPVAERIPEDLLADLRRDPKGGLRLKLRLTPDTLLVGWDIQRRPGFDPNKRDKWGEIVYVGPVHSFAGGDFREAEIFNGQVVRKGWYIDPKTKQRIETDF
jgi:hypothetical protein